MALPVLLAVVSGIAAGMGARLWLDVSVGFGEQLPDDILGVVNRAAIMVGLGFGSATLAICLAVNALADLLVRARGDAVSQE